MHVEVPFRSPVIMVLARVVRFGRLVKYCIAVVCRPDGDFDVSSSCQCGGSAAVVPYSGIGLGVGGRVFGRKSRSGV